MPGNYVYVRRSSEEIRKIARQYLDRFKACRYGPCAVDIEAIQEQLGFEILFRPSLGLDGLKGYAATDAKFIVVSEGRPSKDIRYTVSHEVAHKILEFGLWDNGKIPDGAHSHELPPDQYKAIEENAWELAAELLEPHPEFADVFNEHRKAAENQGITGDAAIFAAGVNTAKDFDVILRAAGRRAWKLGLITEAEHKRAFPQMM
jgi:Zn-dependent peptidase ImmA (M78 family)